MSIKLIFACFKLCYNLLTGMCVIVRHCNIQVLNTEKNTTSDSLSRALNWIINATGQHVDSWKTQAQGVTVITGTVSVHSCRWNSRGRKPNHQWVVLLNTWAQLQCWVAVPSFTQEFCQTTDKYSQISFCCRHPRCSSSTSCPSWVQQLRQSFPCFDPF